MGHQQTSCFDKKIVRLGRLWSSGLWTLCYLEVAVDVADAPVVAAEDQLGELVLGGELGPVVLAAQVRAEEERVRQPDVVWNDGRGRRHQ